MFSKLLEMEYIFSMQRSVRWCFCKFMSTDGTSVTVCRWKMLTKDRLLLQPVETLYFGVHLISVPAWQWIKFSDILSQYLIASNVSTPSFRNHIQQAKNIQQPWQEKYSMIRYSLHISMELRTPCVYVLQQKWTAKKWVSVSVSYSNSPTSLLSFCFSFSKVIQNLWTCFHQASVSYDHPYYSTSDSVN